MRSVKTKYEIQYLRFSYGNKIDILYSFQLELYAELARIFSEENNKSNQRELLMKEGTAKHAQTAHADDRHLPKAIEKLAVNPLVTYMKKDFNFSK